MPKHIKYKPYRLTTSYYRHLKRKKESRENRNIHVHTSYEGASASSSSAREEIIMEPPDVDVNISEVRNPLIREEFFETDPISEDDFERNDEEVFENKLTLLTELHHWAISHKITLTSVTDLLKILRGHGMTDLPKDGRTLLKTPNVTEITEMGGGKFWYNGITSNLQSALSNCNIQHPRTIKLLFNIDGMSPFNSSLYQFWPISFIVEDMHELQPMVAAVYYGETKPPLQLYLRQFVNELNEILRDGLLINGQKITVGIKCFVCDTQARSYIKGTPACNAEYGSCIKCTVDGEWDKKGRHMSYPKFECLRRTDESFRNKTDEDHHKEDTPLTDLPIDMVEDFVVADSLHLFHLGIMRRCLYGWREGSYNFRTKLSKTQADEMSQMLKACNDTKPMDIQRSIRTLKHLKFWKGSEYRVFLLYLGPVILKDFLSSEVYEHFLYLSSAVTILSCKSYSHFLNIAETLLKDYLEQFIDIYGIDSISSNVHNICHVIDDVRKFGTLPEISSYPFENYLGHIKALVRSGNLPLSQISRRIFELSILNSSKSTSNCSINVDNEIINHVHDLPMCRNAYKRLHLTDNFILSSDNRNRYFMTNNGQIVSMINATYFKNKIHVYGTNLKSKYDFFVKPFASSQLNIFASKGNIHKNAEGHTIYVCNFSDPTLYSLSDIKCKLFCIPYHNEFIFIPLIHTLDIKLKLE